MTDHTLESLDAEGVPNYPFAYVATCSCHNPDGEGEDRADFWGDTALEAVRAWQEHADQQEHPATWGVDTFDDYPEEKHS